MGLFDSLLNLAADVATVALTPAVIAADLADAVVKPVAETLVGLSQDVKDLID